MAEERCRYCGEMFPERKMIFSYRNGTLHRFQCKRCYKEERRLVSTSG